MRAIALSLLLLAASALATGGSEGHGADTEWSDAWFLGKPTPIRYCLEASTGFLAIHSDEEYHQAFEAGFALWAKYLVDKKVEALLLPNWVRIRPQLERHACTDQGIELKVYLGLCRHRLLPRYESNSLAAKAIPPRSGEPGLLWLADPNRVTYPFKGKQRPLDWSQAGLIEHTLLHEIGHIFGNSHVRGTIMDEHIVPQLMALAAFGRPLPALSIDGNKALFLCHNCAQETFPGEIGWQSGLPEDWRRLTGANPTTHQAAMLTLSGSSKGTLTLTDAVTEVVLPLSFTNGAASVFKGEEVFRAEFWSGFPLSRQHSALTQPGTMLLKGRPVRISLERNMSSTEKGRPSYPVTLYELSDKPGQPAKRLLFHSGEGTTYLDNPSSNLILPPKE